MFNSILDSSKYRPEKKLVTVLFADIVDSTKLIENLEADEAAAQLHKILATMRAGISRHGGAVNKLQGDGLMAIFGAPVPQEDHAIQACCAAIAIRSVVEGEGQVKIRIGVHTGEAVVQAVNNDISSQYEAMGVAVHIAARAEQAASPSQIIITGTTLYSARDLLETEPLGPKLLKGLSQPIDLFALQSIRKHAASQQFLGGQRISSFIARDDSLVELRAHLERSLSSRSRVVGLVGEPGLGKSRLAFEFVTECRRKGISVIEARATARGQPQPLRPIFDILLPFIGNIRTISEPNAYELLASRLTAFGLAPVVQAISEFLGTSRRDSRTEVRTESATIELIKRTCRELAREDTAVVLLEDLHWLEPASEPYLQSLVEAFSGTRVLLLLTFRPEYARNWMQSADYSQINLPPLPRAAIDAIALELIGPDPSTATLRVQIAERSDGNPFFAEEITRALFDRNVLTGPRGNYSSMQNGVANLLPNTVRGLISFRIDRLEEREKCFLESAAVLGRDFVASVAIAVSQEAPTSGRHIIDRLLALEMIFEMPQGGAEHLAFKHPLVQEVVYASLVSDRKAALHRRAAKALASHFSHALKEHAALIAHHWEEGGELVQAASLYITSATWMGTHDPIQGVRTWKHVRKLAASLPPEGPAAFMRMMACGQIINLSWRESVSPETLNPLYEEAAGLANQLKDARAGALITLAYGRALLACGSADDYLAAVKQAQHILAEAPNKSAAALMVAVESHSTGHAGFLRRALALNANALKQADDIDAADRKMLGFDVKHWLTALRARYLMQTADPAEADRLIEELLRDTLDPVNKAVALGIAIDAAALERDTARALAAAFELEAIAAENSSSYVIVLTNYFRGVAELVLGHKERANDRLEKAIEQSRRDRTGLELEPLMLANLADSLPMERSSDSIAIAAQAQALARRRSQRVAELVAISIKLRILSRAQLPTEPALTEEFERLISVTGAERLRLRVSAPAN